MSSNNTSAAKLHPIYVALENAQYSRAIKLGLQFPPSHKLAQALLAHAYAKSGQRYKALQCMQHILEVAPSNTDAGHLYFPELRLELQYCREHHEELAAAEAAASLQQQSAVSSASSKKGGKKGKKKGGGGGKQQQPPAAATPTPGANLVWRV